MRVANGLVLLVSAALAATVGAGPGSASAGEVKQQPRAAATGESDLALMGTEVDMRTSQYPDKWSAGAGSATWTPYYGTATYTYPLPGSVPGTGVKVSLTLTATGGSERIAPAFSVTGPIVSGDSTISTVGEKGQTSTVHKDVMFQPGAYNPGQKIDVVVGMQDGPAVTYHYVAVRSQQCRARGVCDTAVTANPTSTAPAPEGFTSYKPPAPGKTEALKFPAADGTGSETVVISQTTETGRPGERWFAGGAWIEGTTTDRSEDAHALCFLFATADSHTPSSGVADVVSFGSCVKTVAYILARHDNYVKNHPQAMHAQRARAAVPSCRAKPLGPAIPGAKVTCTRTASGIKVVVSAVSGHLHLTTKSRLVVGRSKYAPNTKRVRTNWHVN